MLIHVQGVHRYGCASIPPERCGAEREGGGAAAGGAEGDSHERARFYVKALQSLLFNRVLQWRVEHFGTKVLAGDLVVGEEGKCRAVTEEDLVGNAVSVYDVVLPLFGLE